MLNVYLFFLNKAHVISKYNINIKNTKIRSVKLEKLSDSIIKYTDENILYSKMIDTAYLSL